MSSKTSTPSLISDIILLFKARVLIANVLPVLTGFWLATFFTQTSLFSNGGLLLLTLVGSTLVMSGALALNNWYDVDIDTVMERTKHRPTVTGHISLRVVLVIGIVLSVAGIGLLLLVSIESAIYAFAGWFTYVILYTMWAKRRYTFNTIIGSISGAVTPLIGWTALASGFHTVPIVYFLILFVWQMPHTYAIAMRKHNEYRAGGVAMLPVVHGFATTKRHIVVYVICLLPLPFFLTQLGAAYIIIATIMNLSWLAVCIRGFFTKDDLGWAQSIFKFSVYYLIAIFLIPIIVIIM
jgi:protoheme IX farnesyltransferase